MSVTTCAGRLGATWWRGLAGLAGLAPLEQMPRMEGSCNYFSTNASTSGSDNGHTAMVNKLLYRSRQRGFLELDLLVGRYAERELPHMGWEQLEQFSEVLEEENPDLFKWLTGQLPPPERLAGNGAFRALCGDVARQLSEASNAAAAAPKGQDWLRGWDDGWRGGQKQQ